MRARLFRARMRLYDLEDAANAAEAEATVSQRYSCEGDAEP